MRTSMFGHRARRLLRLTLDPVGPVTLRKGMNVLVFKGVSEGRTWLGRARFVDREGNLVPGLQVRLTPEQEVGIGTQHRSQQKNPAREG